MHSFENMECLESALNTGAFVSSGGNVMTASWGLVGVMWGRKVYVAPIRDSRYTKELLDRTGEFTVSVPAAGSMKKVTTAQGVSIIRIRHSRGRADGVVGQFLASPCFALAIHTASQ